MPNGIFAIHDRNYYLIHRIGEEGNNGCFLKNKNKFPAFKVIIIKIQAVCISLYH